jgi:hypothetical protein
MMIVSKADGRPMMNPARIWSVNQVVAESSVDPGHTHVPINHPESESDVKHHSLARFIRLRFPSRYHPPSLAITSYFSHIIKEGRRSMQASCFGLVYISDAPFGPSIGIHGNTALVISTRENRERIESAAKGVETERRNNRFSFGAS